ncbi:MAG: hypothetical protein EOM24_21130, partial [Chloroflexia bacterium]|nr:hypothetical protein [Chloroflexia bacterium]
ASVMLHLPALTRCGQINRLANTVSKLGLTIRGAYGEGTAPKGDIYQLSNQITLGITESAALDNLQSIALQLVTQGLNFAVLPFLGFAIGQWFFPDRPFIVMGLLLTALLPTSGMTISWTGFARGNVPAAVKMTVVGLVIGSIATPLYLKLLMGTIVDVPITAIFSQIMLIVFLPMAAGYATQRVLIKQFGAKRCQKEIMPRFPSLSTLGVLGIVFTAIALKATTILANPLLLLRLFVPLVLLYGLNFLISTLIGRFFFTRKDAIALVYGSVMRNLSIALAVAMTAFGPAGSEIALIIALAYVIQVQSAAWYVKFTDRIFGADESALLVPTTP